MNKILCCHLNCLGSVLSNTYSLVKILKVMENNKEKILSVITLHFGIYFSHIYVFALIDYLLNHTVSFLYNLIFL